MDRKALAIANNDLVYLWWTYAGKIDDCLGFSVRRHQAGKPTRALPAFVGFDPTKPKPIKHPTTDYWPIQSYQWKDLFVPEETAVEYEIVPVKGTPGKKLVEIAGLSVRTGLITATDTLGAHRVVFNRGIISTQALTGALADSDPGTPSDAALRKHIGDAGDPIRARLAGEAVTTLKSLLARARAEGGTCFCALYELTDPELVDEIKATAGRVKVILSNADTTKEVAGKQKKVYDGTNATIRVDLKTALGDDLVDRLLPKGNYIGHNKFVVYVDPGGTPRVVLTGSTNWTPTGICAQSNNILVFTDDEIAARYLDYWHRLLDDKAKQAPKLRTDNRTAPPDLALGADSGTTRVWFSPNTKQRTKPSKNPPSPVDMSEVFDAISGATSGVLFLLFSAGAPSILQHLRDVTRARLQAQQPLFVRGAISDATAAKEFTTRVYNDGVLKAPNRLVTGIGGIPGQFSYWEKELAKLGHAVIHDKVLVVDPFTPDCVVVTGSHNLGFKASYSNDENLCIIRGNGAIAEAFTAHVLDIVNHYNWRNKLTELKKKGVSPKKGFTDLAEDDGWQDKYFRGDFLASRDQFFFP